MTFDDDFIQLLIEDIGVVRFPCAPAGIDWPPPDVLCFEGTMYRQVRRSQITDEQRQTMTHVCRGAEYVADCAPGYTRH